MPVFCGNAVCTVDIQYKVESQAASSSLVSEVVSEYSRRLLDDATVPQPPSGPPLQRCALIWGEGGVDLGVCKGVDHRLHDALYNIFYPLHAPLTSRVW